METMVTEGAVMIFSAELLAASTHISTVKRGDGAVTISISIQDPETKIISEVHVTISAASSRELAKKLIHRLEEMHQW